MQTKLDLLIEALERDNKIYICILPLGRYPASTETVLNNERTIHRHPYCEKMKLTHKGLKRCLMSKQLAITKAVKTKKSFAGKCIHGVFEAVCPVVIGDDVAYIVFVGGIKSKDIKDCADEALLHDSKCPESYIETAELIADYIKLLAEKYPYTERNLKHSQIEKALVDYADEYFTANISLSGLSKMFYMNEKYLGRLFKRATGKSFNSYINEKRIKLAESELINTEKSVIEISLDCGYNNVTYFYRLFDAFYGLPPAAYRNKHRKGIMN